MCKTRKSNNRMNNLLKKPIERKMFEILDQTLTKDV